MTNQYYPTNLKRSENNDIHDSIVSTDCGDRNDITDRTLQDDSWSSLLYNAVSPREEQHKQKEEPAHPIREPTTTVTFTYEEENLLVPSVPPPINPQTNHDQVITHAMSKTESSCTEISRNSMIGRLTFGGTTSSSTMDQSHHRGRPSRIPKALQAVFLSSNRGKIVNKPPMDNMNRQLANQIYPVSEQPEPAPQPPKQIRRRSSLYTTFFRNRVDSSQPFKTDRKYAENLTEKVDNPASFESIDENGLHQFFRGIRSEIVLESEPYDNVDGYESNQLMNNECISRNQPMEHSLTARRRAARRYSAPAQSRYQPTVGTTLSNEHPELIRSVNNKATNWDQVAHTEFTETKLNHEKKYGTETRPVINVDNFMNYSDDKNKQQRKIKRKMSFKSLGQTLKSFTFQSNSRSDDAYHNDDFATHSNYRKTPQNDSTLLNNSTVGDTTTTTICEKEYLLQSLLQRETKVFVRDNNDVNGQVVRGDIHCECWLTPTCTHKQPPAVVVLDRYRHLSHHQQHTTQKSTENFVVDKRCQMRNKSMQTGTIEHVHTKHVKKSRSLHHIFENPQYTTSKFVSTGDKTIKSSTALQRYFDKMVASRGYSTTSYSTLETAYHNEPTQLQEACYTPYIVDVVKSGNIYKLRKLLKCGLSSNPCNYNGESLMHLVCRLQDANYSYEMMKLLLQYGAVIQTSDDAGRTPLHIACSTKRNRKQANGAMLSPHFRTIELIMDMDIQLFHMKDSMGRTPLSYVQEEQWLDWINFLNAKKDFYWPVVYDEDSCYKQRKNVLFLKMKPNSRPLPDPDNALDIAFARLVSSGQMEPGDAMLLQNGELDESVIPMNMIEEEISNIVQDSKHHTSKSTADNLCDRKITVQTKYHSSGQDDDEWASTSDESNASSSSERLGSNCFGKLAYCEDSVHGDHNDYKDDNDSACNSLLALEDEILLEELVRRMKSAVHLQRKKHQEESRKLKDTTQRNKGSFRLQDDQ